MKKYLLILTTIAVLSSCQKDIGSPSGGLPMRVDASLAATKASITTADLQEFWLQVDCPSDAAYSHFGKVSKSGTAWSADKQLYWKDETTAVSYTAAFFSGHDFTKAEFTGSVDLSVPVDQSTQAGLNAADLLILKATSTTYESTTDGTLPVVLRHGLTKVNIVLSLGSNFYDNRYGRTDNPVTALAIKGSNLAFNFQPATGAFGIIAGTENDITPMPLSYTPGTATAKTSVATYEAILVPQTLAAGALTVSFSVGTSNYAWTNSDEITLTAGLTVNLPVSVTTAPPPPSINGHEYVDMGEVTIGGVTKNLLWATCNIGANNPWDYGDYYAWGEKATKGSYTWANYAFGSSVPFSRYTGSDYVTLLSEDDAARQLWGGTWHIPTTEEWQALLDGNYYTWVWTDDYLNDGSNHTGRIVTRKDGTGPCSGDSIFLPAAGFRGDSNLYSLGSYGSYWSSSLFELGSYGALGVDFNADSQGEYRSDRYYGLSIRPVSN